MGRSPLAKPARAPSPPFDGSDAGSSDFTSSYSYDSSSRSSSASSVSSVSTNSDSEIRRRHGRRQRFRSRSPDHDTDVHAAPQRPRTEGVLGASGYAANTHFTSAALPSVLGNFGVLPSGPVLAPVEEEKEAEVCAVGLVDGPGGDWPCGVCSNINSEQRADCYRCGCHYTESLLAVPSYEVCLTRLPPGVSSRVAEMALRNSAAEAAVSHVGVDATTGIVFMQFTTVEEATKYLVSRRCEVEMSAADGVAGQRVRLSFSLTPHPRPAVEDAAAKTAKATAEAEKEKTEAALAAAGVPRFLWPHTWNPPSSFPSVEKHKAFLGTMSAHWEHLSDTQKRYYEAEVKQALLKAASPPELPTAPKPEPSAAGESSTAAVEAVVAADSPQKISGKTSHALDGLKKRLAERKTALKKAEGTAAATQSSSTTPGTTQSKSSATSAGGSGDFPSTPACGLAQMQLWDGFPVPLQYAALSDVPQSVELTRVPMAVCERLLPPALLQVARAQFGK